MLSKLAGYSTRVCSQSKLTGAPNMNDKCNAPDAPNKAVDPYAHLRTEGYRDSSWEKVCLGIDDFPTPPIVGEKATTLRPFEELDMKELPPEINDEESYDFDTRVLEMYARAQFANGVTKITVVSIGSGNGRREKLISETLNAKLPKGVRVELLLVDPLSYDYAGSLTKKRALDPDYSFTSELCKHRPDLVGNCVVYLNNASPGNTYEIDALNRLDPKMLLRNATDYSPTGYYCGGKLTEVFNDLLCVGLVDPILMSRGRYIYAGRTTVHTQALLRRTYRFVHDCSLIQFVGHKRSGIYMWQCWVPTKHPKLEWSEDKKSIAVYVEDISQVWEQAYKKWEPDSDEETNDEWCNGSYVGKPDKCPMIKLNLQIWG